MEVLKNSWVAQPVILAVWALLAGIEINRGGRNNRIFRIVVSTGFRLIIFGAVAAALLGATSTAETKVFIDAAIQFVLVLSTGVGGSYIAHANMSLRDAPNQLKGPEQLGPIEPQIKRPGAPAERTKGRRAK